MALPLLRTTWQGPECRAYILILRCMIIACCVILIHFQHYDHPDLGALRGHFQTGRLRPPHGFGVTDFRLATVLPFLLLYASFIAPARARPGRYEVIRLLLLLQQGSRGRPKAAAPTRRISGQAWLQGPVPDLCGGRLLWGFCAVYVFAFAVLFLFGAGLRRDFSPPFPPCAASNNLGSRSREVSAHYGNLSSSVEGVLSLPCCSGSGIFTLLVLFTPMAAAYGTHGSVCQLCCSKLTPLTLGVVRSIGRPVGFGGRGSGRIEALGACSAAFPATGAPRPQF